MLSRENYLILIRFLRAFFDIFLLLISFLLAYFIKVNFILSSDLKLSFYMAAACFGVFLWFLSQVFLGVYRVKITKLANYILSFLISGIVGIAGMNNFFFFAYRDFFSREISLFSFLLGILSLVFNLLIFRFAERRLVRSNKIPMRTLFVGVNRETEKILQKIKKDRFRELNPVAILDARGSKKKEILGIPILGKLDKLEKVRDEKKIEAVFLCDHLEHTFNIVSFAESNFLELFIAPSILGIFSERIEMRKISRSPLISLQKTRLSGWKKVFKDLFDFILSLVLLVVLSPLLLLISLANLSINKKIFSREIRIGIRGQEFLMYRFFTSEKSRESLSFKENLSWRETPELSSFSLFLKKSFLSDLPQLWNIFRGEMSFFGPRPPYKTEFEQYKPFFKRRVSVKPGILGIWQLKIARGEENLNFKKMIEDDLAYISNWSFYLDLKIFLRSLGAFLFRRS